MKKRIYHYCDYAGIFVEIVNGFMHFAPPQKKVILNDENEWYYSTDDDCVRNTDFVM